MNEEKDYNEYDFGEGSFGEGDSRIHELRKICEKLDEKEPDVDKNFYMVNLHGSDNYKEFVVPKGIRLVMFCHARTLYVSECMDQFNWEDIALNENASYNYCTFLSNLADHPSLRDHFCVYNSGDTLNDLDLYVDAEDTFRPGVFRLPVKMAVFVGEDDEFEEDFNQVFYYPKDIKNEVAEDFLNEKIVCDRSKTAYYSKYKDTEIKLYNYAYLPKEPTTLSALVDKLQRRLDSPKEFTMLLLTCRSSKSHLRPTFAPRVYDELEKMYQNYLKQMDIE